MDMGFSLSTMKYQHYRRKGEKLSIEEDVIVNKQFGRNAHPVLIPQDPSLSMLDKINGLIAANKRKEPFSLLVFARNILAV